MKCITLTLNPAYDKHCFLKELRPGYEQLAESDFSDAGGKGVNISRALTVNGIKNNAVIVLGKDNAASFCSSLDADNMEYTVVQTEGKVRENLTIHTDGGVETRISYKGFTADNSLLGKVYEAVKEGLSADTILTFTGSVPVGISPDAVNCFLKKASDKGCKIVIDSKSFKTLKEIAELKPWLIKPNSEEISEYLGRDITSFDEILEVAKSLHAQGIKNVMISLGKKGAILVSDSDAYICTPPEIKAKSTIGAGDSSIAGFIASFMNGKSIPDVLKTSVAYGTAACLRDGTLPPLPQDIEKMLKEVNIKTL